jgi:hypothetical protein
VAAASHGYSYDDAHTPNNEHGASTLMATPETSDELKEMTTSNNVLN